MQLDTQTIDAFERMLINPSEYNIPKRPIGLCFVSQEDATPKHLLFYEFQSDYPQIPKVIFYIVMDKLYPIKKSSSGELGYCVKYIPKEKYGKKNPPFYPGQTVIAIDAAEGSKFINGKRYVIAKCEYRLSTNPNNIEGKWFWYVVIEGFSDGGAYYTPRIFMGYKKHDKGPVITKISKHMRGLPCRYATTIQRNLSLRDNGYWCKCWQEDYSKKLLSFRSILKMNKIQRPFCVVDDKIYQLKMVNGVIRFPDDKRPMPDLNHMVVDYINGRIKLQKLWEYYTNAGCSYELVYGTFSTDGINNHTVTQGNEKTKVMRLYR